MTEFLPYGCLGKTSSTSAPGMMPSTRRRTRSLLLFAFLLALSTGCAAAANAPSAIPSGPPADLAILDVNVVDVRSGRVLPRQTVLVSDGIIQQVAPSSGPANAARTVDGRGMYLIPGLWDMHAHLRANGLPAWLGTEWQMPLQVAHGVTGVRDMSSACENPSQGPVCLPEMRAWQAQIEAGELVGPRIVAMSSFMVDPPWDYPVKREEVAGLMQHLHESGLQHVKVYNRLSPDAFAMVMDEAARLGMDAWGHVPLRVNVADASRAGMRSVEHARDLLYDCFPGGPEFRRTTGEAGPSMALMRAMAAQHDAALCESIFRTFVENGTAYVPTHVTRRMEAFAGDSAFRNDPRSRYVPPPLMQQWLADADRSAARDAEAGGGVYADFYRKGLEITGAAHRAGVRVMVGSDGGDSFSFPGSAVHDEMEELVAAGLSPADALRAATWNGAEFLGMTERHGSVEAGKRADLVLLAANPLDNIRNVRQIHAVILGGRYLDRARLDALLQQAETAAQRPVGPDGE